MDGVLNMLRIQWKCLFVEFRNPGIPWSGLKCRSLRAGASGCLMALPMLVAPDPSEKALWFVQAVLSVWADYFEIHHHSIAHGLDRTFASIMLLRIVWLALGKLSLVAVLVASAIPIFCYSRSAKSKLKKDIEGWYMWHGLWHVTGGFLVTWVWYTIVQCDQMSQPSHVALEPGALCR